MPNKLTFVPYGLEKYKYNYVRVYGYGSNKFVVHRYKCLKQTGLERKEECLPEGDLPWEEGVVSCGEKPGENVRLEENIRRTKRRIREYVLCNPFDMWVTFTLDPKKYNRYDLEKFYSDFAHFMRNYRSRRAIQDYEKKTGIRLGYLIVPEQHKDGAWHMHGVLMGLPVSHLTPFSKEHPGSGWIMKEVAKGRALYDWERYTAKFGFCNVEFIQDRRAYRCRDKEPVFLLQPAYDDGGEELRHMRVDARQRPQA
jgi:hypothetical protein